MYLLLRLHITLVEITIEALASFSVSRLVAHDNGNCTVCVAVIVLIT